MSGIVWVVTNSELGWDCIVGVYETEMSAVEATSRDNGGKSKEELESICFHFGMHDIEA